MVAVVVVLGFPIAMVLSWIFDIVPDIEEEGDETAGTGANDASMAASSFRSATQMVGQQIAHY
jgi:hypothetical protein